MRITQLNSMWGRGACRAFLCINGGNPTSRNPSIDPETKNCPSGEKAAHSAWHFLPNLITGPAVVTYVSASTTRAAVPPDSRSNLCNKEQLGGDISRPQGQPQRWPQLQRRAP
eukprot:scaffold164840_cov32-Tisochrysis_lutea.AAC.2